VLTSGKLTERPELTLCLGYPRYEARDITVAEVARALGVGRGTIYRALGQAS
jgi:predicted DNA-binding transcriptional regulator AlpA